MPQTANIKGRAREFKEQVKKYGGVAKCPDPLTDLGIRWNFVTWKNAPGRFQLYEQQTELKGRLVPLNVTNMG